MRNDWPERRRGEPPPTESAGELERVPRRAGTSTATQQLHLRLTLEAKAAQGLRGVLEKDGKRVVPYGSSERLLAALCVDVATLDLQRYTGSINICTCDAFDQD